jgi:hypothetical protein
MSNPPTQPAPTSTISSSEAAEAKQYITVYNMPFAKEKSSREQAVRSLIEMVNTNCGLLALVFDDAKEYARMAHVGDFDPFDPNAFDVLREVDWKAEVVEFLEELVQCEFGIPRWNALETLCRIDHPAADRVVEQVILGNYPPKYLDPQIDIRLVKCVKKSMRRFRVVST